MPVLVTHTETGGEAQVITGGVVYKQLEPKVLSDTGSTDRLQLPEALGELSFTEQPMPDASMAVTCRFILRNESKYALFTYREKEI